MQPLLATKCSGVLHHKFDDSEEDLKSINRSKSRWIEAMTMSCPTLSRQDIVWALSFVVGVIYSWQLLDHHYDRLLESDVERTVEDVTNDIVAFGCNGVQALIDRRQRERLRLPTRGARPQGMKFCAKPLWLWSSNVAASHFCCTTGGTK